MYIYYIPLWVNKLWEISWLIYVWKPRHLVNWALGPLCTPTGLQPRVRKIYIYICTRRVCNKVFFFFSPFTNWNPEDLGAGQWPAVWQMGDPPVDLYCFGYFSERFLTVLKPRIQYTNSIYIYIAGVIYEFYTDLYVGFPYGFLLVSRILHVIRKMRTAHFNQLPAYIIRIVFQTGIVYTAHKLATHARPTGIVPCSWFRIFIPETRHENYYSIYYYIVCTLYISVGANKRPFFFFFTFKTRFLAYT